MKRRMDEAALPRRRSPAYGASKPLMPGQKHAVPFSRARNLTDSADCPRFASKLIGSCPYSRLTCTFRADEVAVCGGSANAKPQTPSIARAPLQSANLVAQFLKHFKLRFQMPDY